MPDDILNWIPPRGQNRRISAGRLRGGSIWVDRPCDLEMTLPGVIAAGDVRSGTTRRCGFAVGEGSLAITCVHRYLSGLG